MAEHDGDGRGSDLASEGYAAAAERLRKTRLLTRIADALRMPQAELYQIVTTPIQLGTDAACQGRDLDEACTALVHAYRGIHDHEMRLRILKLVQEASGRP
jgi:hypothetical protein